MGNSIPVALVSRMLLSLKSQSASESHRAPSHRALVGQSALPG